MRISQPLCEYLVSHPSDAQRAYCRVSSQAQLPDVANQKRRLEQECQQQHIEVDEWIMEIGGGMNFQRKHDLASGGSDFGGGSGAPRVGPPGSVGTFCLFAVGSSLPEPPVRVAGHEYGRTQLKPHELVQDLITITHCVSSRLYGLRSYRKA